MIIKQLSPKFLCHLAPDFRPPSLCKGKGKRIPPVQVGQGRFRPLLPFFLSIPRPGSLLPTIVPHKESRIQREKKTSCRACAACTSPQHTPIAHKCSTAGARDICGASGTPPAPAGWPRGHIRPVPALPGPGPTTPGGPTTKTGQPRRSRPYPLHPPPLFSFCQVQLQSPTVTPPPPGP